jgi:hypothetical protein
MDRLNERLEVVRKALASFREALALDMARDRNPSAAMREAVRPGV